MPIHKLSKSRCLLWVGVNDVLDFCLISVNENAILHEKSRSHSRSLHDLMVVRRYIEYRICILIVSAYISDGYCGLLHHMRCNHAILDILLQQVQKKFKTTEHKDIFHVGGILLSAYVCGGDWNVPCLWYRCDEISIVYRSVPGCACAF